MNERQIILCPKCGQKLRLPSNEEGVKLKCPTCSESFFYDKEMIFASARKTSSSQFKSKKSNITKAGIAIIIGIILVGLVLYQTKIGGEEKSAILKNSRIASEKPLSSLKLPKLITISYADLLDKDAIIQTGQKLGSALIDTSLRGAVQPFIDKYSYLLQYTIEMIHGPDLLPHSNVIDYYPVGSKQPAWVAILRGGRIVITTDNKNHARVFLIGDDPETAYKKNYSITRHCLSGLLPQDNSSLRVEVFAYKNNYQPSELQLVSKPYIIEATAFPRLASVLPLDLLGLEAFFNQGGVLEGAKLDRDDGLTLYAKKGSEQIIEGLNVSLADFAVAYRAVFHAGDNEAFVSLDPNKDATKTTVNFGGFLEDTRIGSIVLKADKRFKTITCGLDPYSFKDIRNYTRQYVPSFLTCSERSLLNETFTEKGEWVGTRFWFYPESIEVESDFDFKYSRIVNPRFTADAERSKDDFISPEEFEKKKKATLSPSIRDNIAHLNHNYFQYMKAYPELEELTSVARIMGICSWLKKADPQWIDLDALLSVELPPFQTDRETTQLLAATFLTHVDNHDGLNENFVKGSSQVNYLSGILDKTVKDYFNSNDKLAKYLCYKNNTETKMHIKYDSAASLLMSTQKYKRVRELIESRNDLKALAQYAADMIETTEPFILGFWEHQIKSDENKLKQIEARIEEIKIKMNEADPYLYNSYVDEHNNLVQEYESTRQQYNRSVSIYNQHAGNVKTLNITEVGGGINLEPKLFTVKQAASSFELKLFENVVKQATPTWSVINNSGEWIKSASKPGGSSYVNFLPKKTWISKSAHKSNGTSFEHLQSEQLQNYWVSTTAETGSWRDMFKAADLSYHERMFDSTQSILHIAEYKSDKLTNYITGKMIGDDKIIFSRATRQDLIKPEEPPVWWANENR